MPSAAYSLGCPRAVLPWQETTLQAPGELEGGFWLHQDFMKSNQPTPCVPTFSIIHCHVPQVVTPFSVATCKTYLTVLSSDVWMT